MLRLTILRQSDGTFILHYINQTPKNEIIPTRTHSGSLINFLFMH